MAWPGQFMLGIELPEHPSGGRRLGAEALRPIVEAAGLRGVHQRQGLRDPVGSDVFL